MAKLHALDRNTVENDYNFLDSGATAKTCVFGTVYQRFDVSPAVERAETFFFPYFRNGES